MACFQFIERSSPFAGPGEASLPVLAVTREQMADGTVDPRAAAWAAAAGFSAEAGSLLPVPGGDGALSSVLFGLGGTPLDWPFATGTLARKLPAGVWRIEGSGLPAWEAAFGFALGSYAFDRFRERPTPAVSLALPDSIDGDDLRRQAGGVFLARDLVNMPTNHMGPNALEQAFRALAGHYGAAVSVTAGEALLENSLPLIYAVGRASAEAPRLLDMRWGTRGRPKVTLVGKGVCFDTGGLDIKPPASMLLMKKDMGGAANVMALAMMIMDAGLDVDLRVLVPAVENAISGDAFRPSDILTSRKGLTIQVDNTDAEGRLVLADALTLAGEDDPDLVIDMATLTGAARVALGPDLPPFYTRDEALAAALAEASEAVHDPLWRMPLFKPYDGDVSAKVADITNAPAGGFAGSITAALFLGRFVEQTTRWVHFDIYAWNPKDKPHAPVGGEAQGIRALYRVVKQRYG